MFGHPQRDRVDPVGHDVLAREREEPGAQEQRRREARDKDCHERQENQELLHTLRIALFPLGKRRVVGVQLRADDDVDDDEARQHEAGQEGGGEERLDRGFGDQTIDDENDGGRDHRAKTAGGADRANGEILIIAKPQHLWQRG